MEVKINYDLMDIFHASDGGLNAWYPGRVYPLPNQWVSATVTATS
jgi:hypothetical protein